MAQALNRMALFLLGLLLMQSVVAVALDDLTAQAPGCQRVSAALPKLRASKDAFKTIVTDLNGDGWCDTALAVPYPFNSRMESYWLEDMVVLGGPKGWRHPLKGKKSWSDEISFLDPHIWPTHQVDLTGIVLLYPRSGGAPYILGLIDGYEFEKEFVSPGCQQYTRVHQWDADVDAFKKVDDAARDAVLSFYYSKVEKPCKGTTMEPGANAPK